MWILCALWTNIAPIQLAWTLKTHHFGYKLHTNWYACTQMCTNFPKNSSVYRENVKREQKSSLLNEQYGGRSNTFHSRTMCASNTRCGLSLFSSSIVSIDMKFVFLVQHAHYHKIDEFFLFLSSVIAMQLCRLPVTFYLLGFAITLYTRFK